MDSEKLEPIVLTAREQAIARGDDPDAVKPVETTQKAVDGTPAPVIPASPVAEAEGTEAQPSTPDSPKLVEQPEPVGEGTAPPQEQGTAPVAGPEKPATWINDDLRGVAASFGLSEAELQQFSGPEEFQRAVVLTDRYLVQKGTLPPLPTPSALPQKPTEPSKTPPPAGKIDRQKFVDEGYNETVLGLIDAHNDLSAEHDRLCTVVEQFSNLVQQAEAQQRLNAFHDLVDTMSEKRYGRSVDAEGRVVMLGVLQDANRRKLWETATGLRQGIVATNPSANPVEVLPSLRVLLQRAENAAFHEELQREAAETRSAALVAQAKKRRPAQAPARETRVVNPNLPPSEQEVQQIASHPEMQKLWARLNAESGKQ